MTGSYYISIIPSSGANIGSAALTKIFPSYCTRFEVKWIIQIQTHFRQKKGNLSCQEVQRPVHRL